MPEHPVYHNEVAWLVMNLVVLPVRSISVGFYHSRYEPHRAISAYEATLRLLLVMKLDSAAGSDTPWRDARAAL